jgi:hypothetical protein
MSHQTVEVCRPVMLGARYGGRGQYPRRITTPIAPHYSGHRTPSATALPRSERFYTIGSPSGPSNECWRRSGLSSATASYIARVLRQVRARR